MSAARLKRVTAEVEQWPLTGTFTISRGSKTEAEVVVVAITSEDGHQGRGECVPYARYGETIASVTDSINEFSQRHNGQFDLQILQQELTAGAARNALDCALWDLNAKQTGQRVWEILGHPQPQPTITAYTLSLDSVEAMRKQAEINQHRPLLKIKLGPEGATERIQAIRSKASSSSLIVDANEAWTLAQLDHAMSTLVSCNVVLIEQPLPADQDDALKGFKSPIPIAADESCHTSADVPVLVEKYDVVNIKLDKSGGLSEALKLKTEAMNAGLDIMVGCMMATSLAMAPATLLTESASVVDLDGPLWLRTDRADGLTYKDHKVNGPDAALWG